MTVLPDNLTFKCPKTIKKAFLKSKSYVREGKTKKKERERERERWRATERERWRATEREREVD